MRRICLKTSAIACLLVLSTSFSAAAVENQCRWKSPSHVVMLAELFTSQGCSSCPPADRWLSREMKKPGQEQHILPLSFHVDYWDYIGWKDPYANPQFTQRQYSHRQAGNTSVIYTPQYILAGKEWRNWGRPGDVGVAIQEHANKLAPVVIDVSLDRLSPSKVSLRVNTSWVNSEDLGANGRLYVSVYEDRLVQHVSSGENKGDTLRHDGVVRAMLGPFPVSPVTGAVNIGLTLGDMWINKNLGLGLFVENGKRTNILQALNVPNALEKCRS